MKIPRDCSGTELARALRKLGYNMARQTGSHMILTTTTGGEHHITVPAHHPIKLGTLQQILKSVAGHHRVSLDELLQQLGL